MCVFSDIRGWTHATWEVVSGLQPEGASSAYLEWASDGPSGNDFSTSHQLGMRHITLTHKHVHTPHTHFPMWNYLVILSLFIVYLYRFSLCDHAHSLCSVTFTAGCWRSAAQLPLSYTHWAMQPALQQHFPNIRETLALSSHEASSHA